MEKGNIDHLGRPLSPVTSVPVSLNQIGDSLTSEEKYAVLEAYGHEGLQSLDDIPDDVQYMINKIEGLDTHEAVTILKEIYESHKDDLNMPISEIDKIQSLIGMSPSNFGENIDGLVSSSPNEKNDIESRESSEIENDWQFQVRLYAALFGFHSPYAEIRSVTDAFDDPTIPVETIRAYFLGFLWTIIGSFVNGFFYHRQPSITLQTSVVQIFLYPCGLLCQSIFPDWGFTFRGTRHSLNPGPWTHKEQLFATIIYSVSATPPYVIYNIIVQKLDVYYGNKWANWGYQILLTLSTQFLGFGLAGILRRFVIYPTRSIWPIILPTLSLNRALLKPEKNEKINGWRISRYYFFFITFAIAFVYFWVPNYLFAALSTFNWMTWIKPDNFNLAMITGSQGGLGVNPIPTFDPNVIFFNSPLALPFFSQLSNYIGMLIGFIVICAIYWTNNKWTAYLPINSNQLFTNTGERFNIREILTENFLFDQEKYANYSPPFYSAGNLVVYGAFFAVYPFVFLYMGYTEWSAVKYSTKQLYNQIRRWKGSQFEGYNDPHTRMMMKYKEVPDWCFMVILVLSFIFGVIVVKVYPQTNTPVWSLVFVIGINVVFLLPFSILSSVTGVTLGLNVLVELIVGYALPGDGIALMLIKAYGYNIDGQAQNYISDQKMAHYGKIPPRALFRGQLISTLISMFVSLGTLQLLISTVDGLCTPHQVNKFSCPSDNTFFSASIIWGVIGPKKVFNGLYPILRWCFLIGALLPIPMILIHRYVPRKYTHHIHPVILLSGMLNWAPYNLSYYTGGLYMSLAFMYYIRKKYLSWWEKYNYLLSAGITAGVAFSAIIIFFAVQYHEKDVNWWGNSVPFEGLDYEGPPLLDAATAPDGYFGPRIGHFP